jgi:hypothetical protein
MEKFTSNNLESNTPRGALSSSGPINAHNPLFMYNNLLAFFWAFSISSGANVRACVGPSQSGIISSSSGHCQRRTGSDQAFLRILYGTDPKQEHQERVLPGYPAPL